MTEKNQKLAVQWAQLLSLTCVHFLADVFPGMMHSILPAVQAEFGLSIVLGGVFLGAFNFSSNWMQVLTGHMRADKTKPMFMYIGLMFAVAICLLAILPKDVGAFPLMMVLALISGAGVAIIHPEALRALHSLDRISPAMSTAVFMVGGILGFALGGKYSTDLVVYFGGVRGLFPLAMCPVFCIITLVFLKVHLAVEKDDDSSDKESAAGRLSFWPVMVMATLAGISSSVVVWIAPQKLSQAGLELTFGGYSVMMFSLGGGLGAFFWAAIASKFGDLLCSLIALVTGIPLMVAYAILIEYESAVWLFFAGSFCAFGSYPLVVSIARGTTGPKLGQRMALIVGGSWGIACLFPIILAPAAQRFGVDIIMLLSPIGYVLACFAVVFIMIKIKSVDSRKAAIRE